MQRVISIALASALFLASYALDASTPGTPGPWDTNTFPSDGASAIAVTGHIKCVITEVRGNRTVQIWDQPSQQNHLIRIAEEVPIKVRRKRDFDGREKIDFGDLRPGHRVKLTYRTSDGTIVGVKVIDRVSTLPRPR